MKLFQKTLSVLLALVLLCGVFTIIPAAADEGAPEDAAEQTVLTREKSVDLSEVGAEADLAGTGHYNIAVGNKVVTENNYNNILGDSSNPHKAVYDPQKKILTLNDPTITKVYDDDPENGAILIQQNGVTIRGSFHMSSAISNYGLTVTDDCTVTLDGNFTFVGKKDGIVAGGRLTVNGGSIMAKGTDADSYGVYCDDLVVNSSVTKLTMEGRECSFVGDHLTMNGTRITSPADAFFTEVTRSICLADFSDLARRAVIQPFNGTYYDLWLGSRRVTSENYRDIYGDGKASYDPQSKTLTLNDPTIVGAHCQTDNMNMNQKIYAESDLTVKGSYHIKPSDLDLFTPEPGSSQTDDPHDLYDGIRVKGNLTLDGDFTFLAKGNPVIADGNITIQSGTIKVVGDIGSSIVTLEGNIILKKTLSSLDVSSPLYPLWAREIKFDSGLKIVEPANGVLGLEGSSNHQFIAYPDGSSPTHIVIEPSTEQPVVNYNIVVGGTVVTSRNKTDILGDGKARYNPDTNTLTLDNPTLTDVYANETSTFSILSLVEGLTIAGSLHMTSADATYGYYSFHDTTFDGDFTFRGTSYATYTQKGLTIRSGSLKAISNGNFAIYNDEGAVNINSGVSKVDASSAAYAIVSPTISLGQDMNITSPAGASLYTITSQNLQTIVTNGSIAKSVVIEYQPATPTEVPTQAPTTAPPTQAPTTAPPTQAPTAAPPTQAPTERPSEAGLTLSLEGKGTSSAPYLIKSTDDWNELKTYLSRGGETAGVCFKLDNDITVSTMIGTSGDPFKGIFDGDGHTLTLQYGSADNPYPDSSAAPFSNVYGCTVKNLNVSGSIYTSSWFAGSIVGWQDGNVTIENCQSDAVIVLSKSGDGSSGGLVGRNDGGALIVNNCVFSGKLLTTADTTYCGGLVGSRKNAGGSGTITVSNSLYAPAPLGEGETEVLASGGAALSRGNTSAVTITNSYYTRTLGKAQGKQAYTISGDNVTLTLNGTPGLTYRGTIYAGKGDFVKLNADAGYTLYAANAGTLTQKGSSLWLDMPEEDVTISVSTAVLRSGFADAASTAGYNNEGPANLVDGKESTKWCGEMSSASVKITFNAKEPVTLVGYMLTTANDTESHSDRNPIQWTLEGSTDGSNWTELSYVNNAILPGKNYQSVAVSTDAPVTTQYQYYRFTILKNGGATSFQLSELRLYTKEKTAADEEYDLWLGDTRVSYQNKDDIFGDGKASFDPNTNTLTLRDPVISGIADTTYYSTAKIVSKRENLVIEGSYHMTEYEARYGLFCMGALELKGDFTFMGLTGMYANNATTFTSGTICFKGTGKGSQGISIFNSLTVGAGITKLTAESDSYNAIICYGSIQIPEQFLITSPENGAVKQDQYNTGYQTISSPGIPYAMYVVIEPDAPYNLWVGSTRVTVGNRNDILNDGGKAKYDPDTNTLTLDDPVISGTYNDAKIYTETKITLKGSYHMTEKETGNGLRTKGATVSFSGDFTFMGTSCGVLSRQYTSVKSGSLKAIGGFAGIDSNWEMFLEKNAQKVELEGDTTAYSGNKLVFEGNHIIEVPENGAVHNPNGYYRIFESDNATIAKKAVIKLHKILGDVDGDGEVTSIDSAFIQRDLAWMDMPANYNPELGDVDGDGNLTTIDATFIERWLARMDVSFPIGELIKES